MKVKPTILAIFFVFSLFGSVFAKDGELPGDANCDGVVNVLDVTAIANFFAGNEPDPFCFENADVNGDGLINVKDIVLTLDIFFSLPEPGTVTDIDGNVYRTVIIGDREWMAENLRVTRYNNEEDIPTGLSNQEWSTTTEGAYAIYFYGFIDGLNSDEEVLEAYGALYNWYAVNTGNLCPEGWSVPSDAEWTALTNYLAGEGFPNGNFPLSAGNALKSCRQVNSPLEDCNTSEHPRWNPSPLHIGLDEFGFSALPGGYRLTSGGYVSIGDRGNWWSTNQSFGSSAWARGLYALLGLFPRNSENFRNGFSVRCLKDID